MSCWRAVLLPGSQRKFHSFTHARAPQEHGGPSMCGFDFPVRKFSGPTRTVTTLDGRTETTTSALSSCDRCAGVRRSLLPSFPASACSAGTTPGRSLLDPYFLDERDTPACLVARQRPTRRRIGPGCGRISASDFSGVV